MLEEYLVKRDSLENVTENGKITGIRLTVKCPGYRGNFLSLLNGYYFKCDGIQYSGNKQKLEINGKPPRSFEELKKESWEFWNMGDEARLYIEMDGGLKPGKHIIELQLGILEQYGYGPMDEKLVAEPPEIGELIPGRIVDIVRYELEVHN